MDAAGLGRASWDFGVLLAERGGLGLGGARRRGELGLQGVTVRHPGPLAGHARAEGLGLLERRDTVSRDIRRATRASSFLGASWFAVSWPLRTASRAIGEHPEDECRAAHVALKAAGERVVGGPVAGHADENCVAVGAREVKGADAGEERETCRQR